MASTATISLTSTYADGKTRKIELGPLAPAALTNVKSKIIARNDADFRQQNYAGFDSGFVSANGADFVAFTAAKITVTDTTVLF